VAAGFYAEAETIASEICGLVRDEGLKYRDILVLCNDMRTRVPIMKRVFQDYGLPVFIDQRRTVDHNPVIELVLALIETAAGRRRYEDVFRLLKTGLTDIVADEREVLENYVLEHKIRGGMWDKEFTYGGPPASLDANAAETGGVRYAYTAEEMQALNETRSKVSGLLGAFENAFRARRTAREKTECLRGFLEKNLLLTDKIAAMAEALEDSGNLEYAAELSGIENVVAGLLDQLSAALGERELSPLEYSECLRAGFASVRMGVLPTGTDQIVIGTMQRTRSAAPAAVFVAGANDGVLPAATEDDGVLNSDEKQRLESAGNFLGRSDDTVYFEEQLAIYRNMSKSSKKLYLSCSASDMDGNNVRPSNIFERVRRLFPEVPVKKDIISGADELAQIQYPEEALAHLADHAVKAVSEGRSDLGEPWRGVWKWLGSDPEYRPRIAGIRLGLAHRSGGERVSPDTLKRLMGAKSALHTSPSALERYSRCPFSWFAGSALRLTGRRVRELDYGGIGDLYHMLLMGYGETVEHNARWDEITRAECGAIIREIYHDAARTYREGLLGNNDGYSDYKAERISRVAEEVAWAVTNQVRGSDVAKMLFEARFGSGAGFSPLEIPVPDAHLSGDPAESEATLVVSGRIDRVDILAGESAVITDYKSGSDTFSSPDVRGGWQLQLLIYLMAVTEKYRPGGVRYFGIGEPHIEDTGRGDAYLEEKISKEFKPDGLFADPAQPDNELESLTRSVRERLENLAAGMFAGSVGASPLTARKLKSAGNAPLRACTYCAYKGVCGYGAP
jgi:ATP-dependent helicase/nuclease subunit B